MMRTIALAATALLFLFTACSGSDDDVAADPGGDPGGAPGGSLTPPAGAPAAPGQVRSRSLATVMDRDTEDDEVELCLGAVAESYPPQCGGPLITNWEWDADYARGMFDEQGTTRWATFAVTGTWDGAEFTVEDAIPGALYDAFYEEPSYPEPAREYTEAELQEISDGLAGELPGYQGSYADAEGGRVISDVLYDDGSLQDYVDQTYGENVVIVLGALIDVIE